MTATPAHPTTHAHPPVRPRSHAGLATAILIVGHLGALAPHTTLAADTPTGLQAQLASEARAADPRFTGFSADRGRAFFSSRHGGDWSCTTCHTDNPSAAGSHKVTGKVIEPLAPAANPARFTRADKVEKWFKRNCNDVLQRPCTAQEKGDVIAYLLTVRP